MVQGDGDYHNYSWIINQYDGVEVLRSWLLADRYAFDYHHRVFTTKAKNWLRWGLQANCDRSAVVVYASKTNSIVVEYIGWIGLSPPTNDYY